MKKRIENKNINELEFNIYKDIFIKKNLPFYSINKNYINWCLNYTNENIIITMQRNLFKTDIEESLKS